MVDTIPLLSKLFAGIPRQDGVALMNEMGATIRKIPAGGIVLREGSLKRNIGVLLDGSLEMYETDVDGHRSMVGMVYPQESFALVFAFAAVERHPATIAAVEDSEIMVIPVAAVLPSPGAPVSSVRRRFIRNMLGEICETAWRLRARAFILSRRSTTERLMTYLRMKMRAKGTNDFEIPFDRQGLADFLCVDRSALLPDVCVDTDGEIYLEWKPRRGRYCSVTMSGDGRYHCLVKDGVRKTLCTTNAVEEALEHVVRICA